MLPAQLYAKIVRKAVVVYGISLDSLMYDTTNYYNYWNVTTESELSRMTKSRAGKKSLRHIGLALAVDRDWGLPLFFRLYPANEHNSKVIKGLLDELFEHIRSCTSDKKGITLVFDKGNNSEELIARLDESRHYFIGSRSPYHHEELCNIPIEHYQEAGRGNTGALAYQAVFQRGDNQGKWFFQGKREKESPGHREGKETFRKDDSLYKQGDAFSRRDNRHLS